MEEHDILMYGHHPPLDTPPPASSFHEPQVAFHPTSLPQAAPTTLQHVHMTSISPSCRMSHTSLRKLANLSIINTAQTLEDLWKTLDNLDLTNTERLRPRWDTYFMVSELPFSPTHRFLPTFLSPNDYVSIHRIRRNDGFRLSGHIHGNGA